MNSVNGGYNVACLICLFVFFLHYAIFEPVTID